MRELEPLFLCRTFDLWFEKYRKRLSIRDFDAVLNRLVLGQMPLCILDGSCHNQLTIEHDGAVFGCDHFAKRLQTLHDQVANQRIVVHYQNPHFGSVSHFGLLDRRRSLRVGLTGPSSRVGLGRRYMPLLPPIFSTR